MGRLGKKLVGLSILCLVCQAGAAAGIRLQLVRHAVGEEGEYEDYLLRSRCLNEMITRLNEHFRFPAEITLQVGTSDGPLYDVATRTIRVPFDLGMLPSPADERLDMVERSLLVPGALAFAVSHELGHALVHLYGWPVHGSAEEEEAADAVAVYLVTQVLDCGESAAEALAEMARLDPGGERPFAGRACISPPRAQRLFCWLTGAAPEPLGWLWRLRVLQDETPASCREGYSRIEKRLGELLRPAERSTTDDLP